MDIQKKTPAKNTWIEKTTPAKNTWINTKKHQQRIPG
jgi:hypothetical protein